jgi:hydrogenase expression/formation protein HypC
MCLAIPMKVVEIDGLSAVAEVDGVRRQARLDLVPEVEVGDYVLIHAGMAITRLEAQDALETLALLRQIADEIQ